MVAALVLWQFDLDGNSGWSNAPAERVIGNVGLREGRNVEQLGGPVIPSQCSALQLVLNNFDGYYTFGAGMALGPGSKIRLRWRAMTGTPWVTRFVGSLSTLLTGTDANPIMITRWVGALYRFTSGNIPGRLIINQTPQSIMTVLSDAAGIPATDRDFDTLATLYNRQLSPGYQGVQEVQTMVGGFIYDSPDKVRLELPATRAAKAVVARYTDGDPTAAELGVPAPRRLIRPFGIINHVDGQYQYYTPVTTDGLTIPYLFPQYNLFSNSMWLTRSQTLSLGFVPSDTASIAGYTLAMYIAHTTNVPTEIVDETLTVTSPDDSGELTFTIVGVSATPTARVRNIVVSIQGNTICFTWEAQVRNQMSLGSQWDLEYTLSVMVHDTSFEQEIKVFERSITDGGSVDLFGYRPRQSPLVIGIHAPLPLANDFVPNYAELDAAIQSDLDAYATPIPVFAVERACDTADHRADILARRLSDKVHLTADGPSKIHAAGMGLDAFIEAIQTTIAPTGELTQTLWIEAA